MTMQLRWSISKALALSAIALLPTSAFGQNTSGFDWIDFWNLCEAFPDHIRVGQQADHGDIRYELSLGVDNATVGKNTCQRIVPTVANGLSPVAAAALSEALDIESETRADLGPSLVGPDVSVATPSFEIERAPTSDCPTGGDPVERNELRFKDDSSFIHPWSQPAWYSLTFRMSGKIYPCGSARWVIGQWKQRTSGNESPVLAQRFDNGVFHVTVQDRNCRCVIAKAPGDFDLLALTAKMIGAPEQELAQSRPIKCLDSEKSTQGHEVQCVPEVPIDMQVWTIGGADPPELPDPKAGLVTMTYLVEAGDDARIEVYANGEFVVRVTGNIGFDDADVLDDRVKFKLGHYREWIPGGATLSVSRLCVSKDVRECEPALDVMP